MHSAPTRNESSFNFHHPSFHSTYSTFHSLSLSPSPLNSHSILFDIAQMPDVHPELMYQVGATPHFTEKAKEHCAKIAQLSDGNKPLTICPPEVLCHGFS